MIQKIRGRERMIRKFVLLFVLALAVTAFAGGKVFNLVFNQYGPQKPALSVVTTVDTAEVVDVSVDGIDSFLYHCSLTYNASLANWDTLSWVSHPTIRRFGIDADTDVPDTTITYSIDFDFGTNTVGFDADYDDGDAIITIAGLIDALVDSINNITTIKDTVQAEDSVTYILLRSLIAQEGLEGDARWVLVLGDSTTEMDSTFTTAAMAIDSLCALINADDSMSAHITANDSTTKYTVISDDVGLDIKFCPTDTSQDTTYVQLNVASANNVTDTIYLPPIMYSDLSADAFYGRFILEPSVDTAQGIGDSDSGYLILYTMFANELKEIARDSAASLPCTLRVAIGTDTTGGGVDPDTLFNYGLAIVYAIMDTASDTTVTVYYELTADYEIEGE